eukprot:4020567-Alexandrium_andersonii.AAC.1
MLASLGSAQSAHARSSSRKRLPVVNADSTPRSSAREPQLQMRAARACSSPARAQPVWARG